MVVDSQKRGGLVSKRVEMYEAPLAMTKRGYRARPQDSFDSPKSAASDSLAVESRQQQQQQSHEQRGGGEDYIGSALIESGVNHYAAGEYEKALKAFTTALKTQRVSLGDEDISIALTLGNLGSVYLQLADFDEAENVLLESLLMKRRLKPNLIVSDTLNNLGNCANLRGDYDQSLEYYRGALEDLRAKKGRRQDLANTLFNLGRLEIQKNNWESARTMLDECYRLVKELYGTNHHFVAQTLDLIGFVQLSTDDLDGAMISFTKALGIFRRLYGPLHLDVANSLFNVGMVRELKDDLSEAWESYTTTRDLYQRLGTNADHPGFKNVRQSISNVEKAIAKENQERLIAKHGQARSAKVRQVQRVEPKASPSKRKVYL